MRSLSSATIALVLSLPLTLASSGCMTAYKKSVGADTQQVYSRVFATDYNVAWQAVLDALKSSRLDVSNRESGTVQTRWTNNTAEKNFADSDGTTPLYMKAQYRFKVSLSRGYYKSQSAVKVTVQREQLVQRDALEDFRAVESDSIEENTLLYRISRIVNIRVRLAKLEEARVNAEIQNSGMGFGPVPGSGPDGSSGMDSPDMTPDSTFEDIPAPPTDDFSEDTAL